MSYRADGWYDKERNLVHLSLSGEPESEADAEKTHGLISDLCECLPHKFYVIIDVCSLSRLSLRIAIDFYLKMRAFKNERSALSVIVADNPIASMAYRLYSFASSNRFPVVKTKEDAVRTIEKAQKVHGLRPSLK